MHPNIQANKQSKLPVLLFDKSSELDIPIRAHSICAE